MTIEIIPFILMPFFSFLWGFKMFKVIIDDSKDYSDVFLTGMIYGGIFVLSVLLNIVINLI